MWGFGDAEDFQDRWQRAQERASKAEKRIAELEAQLATQRETLTGKLATAHMERDEYQDKYHKAHEVQAQMTNAATMAAASAATALERLQHHEAIVNAVADYGEALLRGPEGIAGGHRAQSADKLRRLAIEEAQRRRNKS